MSKQEYCTAHLPGEIVLEASGDRPKKCQNDKNVSQEARDDSFTPR